MNPIEKLGNALLGTSDTAFVSNSRQSRVALQTSLIDQLHSQGMMITLGMTLLGLLTVATLVGHIPMPVLVVWSAVLVAISLCRFWLIENYSGIHPECPDATPQARRTGDPARSGSGLSVPGWHGAFFLLALASGVQWGLLGLYVTLAVPLADSVLFYITVTGAVGASAASTSASPPVFRAFSVTVLVPLSLALIMQQSSQLLALGLMTAAFTVITWISSTRANRVLRSAITHGLENKRLLELSRRAERRFIELNRQLREQVTAKTAVASQMEAKKREADALASRLLELSSTDALTELANRRAFDEELERTFRKARETASPLALVLVDIDFFKKYNDSLGHPAGDRCLRSIARVMESVPCSRGRVVARYGGEEFALVLPGQTAMEAVSCAERLREAVAAFGMPHPESTVSNSVTVSCGVVSLVPTRASDKERLIRLADRSLYEAKQRGRNRVWCADLARFDDVPAAAAS